jgi:rare lipoprotein A
VPLLRGVASWYSERDAGARTASGQRFDDAVKTCASWDFPFGTYLRVTNAENGLAVICRVNDRGPHLRLGRAVDLTVSAFRSIAGTEKGLVRVVIEPLGPYAGRSWPRRNFREMSGSSPQ